MTRFALTGARVFDGEAIREDTAVLIEGVRIADIIETADLDADLPRRKLDGGLLAPGFIDAQVNGGGGALLNAEPTVAGVRRIAQAHRRFGTTGLLPTVVTDRPKVIAGAAAAVGAARQTVPGVLGIHVEGPFIDMRRKGAHDAQFIRPMAPVDIAWLKSLDCGIVMTTLAPSTVDPQSVQALAQAGIIVSLGHAEATAEEALAALAAGARGFTHLFNAMSQLSPRAPGMVGAALSHSESFCGLIADGHHVEPVALKVALAAKPKGRLFLVSDAMPTAAGGPDRFLLQGREVRVTEGRLMLADGTLAGSNLTMDAAVRYAVSVLGLSLEEALRMASLYPAAFLKLDDRLGRIRSGYLASLVHLSDDLGALETWIEGKEETSSALTT